MPAAFFAAAGRICGAGRNLLHIKSRVTNNNFMNEAMVYLTAAGFALSLFPFHLYNYIYINSEKKYASLNVGLYRFFTFFNVNTVEDKPGEMQINGKNKKINLSAVKLSAYKIFNKLCVCKIVQLSDFGLKNENNAYAALAQNAFTSALYKFIEINGGYAKLRNYTVLNETHSHVAYYCKAVTILNFIVAGRILLILISEKFHGKN